MKTSFDAIKHNHNKRVTMAHFENVHNPKSSESPDLSVLLAGSGFGS